MWPQKWKASASPGRTARATSPPAVSAVIAPPIRARKPRREVPAASPSSALPTESPAGSGNERLRDPPFAPAVLRGGEDALELREVVERALREHGAVEIERDRERAPGNAELAPRRRVGVLLERPHGEFGIACEHGDGRLERRADPASLGDEHGQRELHPRRRLDRNAEGEAGKERDREAEAEPLVGRDLLLRQEGQ